MQPSGPVTWAAWCVLLTGGPVQVLTLGYLFIPLSSLSRELFTWNFFFSCVRSQLWSAGFSLDAACGLSCGARS